ncbi:MAG: diaminopimelate epimerase [Candidatus Cloacimonetes bacterium]|nr:diaminopimelate epimerase [Candidatus Cloacimonadota bacterium]
MKLEFIKITAQGNDYIYIDRRTSSFEPGDIKEIVVKLSDRHFGIGSDGVVFLTDSTEADVRMEMYNADGSRGAICGSALRSVVYLLAQAKEQAEYSILTDSGLRRGWLDKASGQVKVGMGNVMQYDEIHIDNDSLYLVDVGNRHLVKIVDRLSELDLPAEISEQENELDKKDVNREFVEISGADSVTMKVYELGSGFTLACGSGAVAAAYTCRQEGKVMGDEIRVLMPGGEVLVTMGDDELYLTGEVQEVFRGNIEI